MLTNKRALICGISGQDGSYLAKLLLDKEYEVVGTSRDSNAGSFKNLKTLGIFDRVKLISMATSDFSSVIRVIKAVHPDEIYNLGGQTSVGNSFDLPVETVESIEIGTLNILEAIRIISAQIKFYNAGSSECFGNTGNLKAVETTPFSPKSPYAVAKCAAHWHVENYRASYGLFACSGILFNHESCLRPPQFVTMKIVSAAKLIADGKQNKLELGNIDIIRDWGWAPEYTSAMWLMLQADSPEDYVIATGESYSLREFVAKVFDCFGLDWEKYVVTRQDLMRPNEILASYSLPLKAKRNLGWEARYKIDEIVQFMAKGFIV
jgi:GDPmannose 4,6-dehydratase